jgi:protein-disulfide isomerase
MRTTPYTTIAALVFVAGTSHCTRDAGPETGGPPPVQAPTAGAPAAAPADPVYRVPIDDEPSLGDPRALVTVVAFVDYECPYCRKAGATLERLRATYAADLRIVPVMHALPMHARARPAALAAIAAGMQGRFEPMHARLLAGALDDASIEERARAIGLDVARFDADRAGPAAARALDRAAELGARIGVTGTPTFFVNGRRVAGAQSYDVLRAVVDERLAAARELMRSGVRADRVYAETMAAGLPSVAPDDEGAGRACNGEGTEGCARGKGDIPRAGGVVESVPTSGAPARGPGNASVTVVLFSDYQCPFCAKEEPVLRAFEQAHPGDVRVVFKNLPLPMHENARLAAKAALAAAEQGRYWEYHDALFAHQDALDRGSLERYAEAVGLDARRFARDLDGPALDARIEADVADAEALSVKGTPTLFVNGRRVVGAQPIAVLESALAPTAPSRP